MNYRLHILLSKLSASGNNIAKVILDNYEKLKKTDLGTSTLIKFFFNPAGPPHEESIQNPEPQDNWCNRDLRISHLRVKGFRSVPSDEFYGIKFICSSDQIDLCDSVTPASLILLGVNGSGKTSLYSALEFLCLGKTAIAQKHRIKDDDLKKFYHNYCQSNSSFEIEVILNCESYLVRDIEKSKISNNINLENFFCSESDIAIFECSGDDIEAYVLSQIGLSDAIDIIKLLDSFIQEINDREAANEDIRMASLKDKVNEVKSELEKMRDEIRGDVLSEAQSILVDLTKEYIEDDPNIELGFEEINDRQIFNGKLKKGSDIIDPRYYFNNFRFKLYLISIRIAIAFYIMDSRKVRFPLLFDDIFDSSDFENRLSSKKFFKKILDYYNRRFVNGPSLQILFFTQDEVIGESVYEAIVESVEDSSNISSFGNKVILGRLFMPNEAEDEKDKVMIKSQKSENENTDSPNKKDQKEYYNLYDVISSN